MTHPANIVVTYDEKIAWLRKNAIKVLRRPKPDNRTGAIIASITMDVLNQKGNNE